MITALAGALLVSGCVTVGPDYVRPEIVVADQWHQTGTVELLRAFDVAELDQSRVDVEQTGWFPACSGRKLPC